MTKFGQPIDRFMFRGGTNSSLLPSNRFPALKKSAGRFPDRRVNVRLPTIFVGTPHSVTAASADSKKPSERDGIRNKLRDP
jgi:hypothetical protein